MLKSMIVILFSLFFSFAVFAQTDGPYFLKTSNGKIVRITQKKDKIIQDTLEHLPEEVYVAYGDGRESFRVVLHPLWKGRNKTGVGDSLYVVGDAHGDFEHFTQLLQEIGLINSRFDWIGGKKHLAIVGDIFDRGNQVTQLAWLIYKLEAEAKKSKGHVHFIWGNHEDMMYLNDVRYVHLDYKHLVESLGMSYRDLWGNRSYLGAWLKSQPIVKKVGKNLLVHGGLSDTLVKKGLTINKINRTFHRMCEQSKAYRCDSIPNGALLGGKLGPLWYRGLVLSKDKYEPISKQGLKGVFTYYNVERIVVGHTIVDSVSFYFDGRVVDVNINDFTKEKRWTCVLITKDGRCEVVPR